MKMSSRSNRSLRGGVFTVALLGGVVVLTGQSCTEARREREKTVPSGQSPAKTGQDGSPDETIGGAINDVFVPETTDAECPEAGAECGNGFRCCQPCCLAGAPLACTKTINDKCPLPDLSVAQGALATGIYVETIEAGACELQEVCLAGSGERRVLRFDVRVPNTGVTDLVLGAPDAGGPFQYAPCHKHYHFNGFAKYTLLDNAGTQVVVGRKQAFCARDSARVDQTAPAGAHYDCNNQGIQKGWADIYDPTLPCQYLDITDLPSGTYHLEVEVNPEHTITELDYGNNKATVKVDLP